MEEYENEMKEIENIDNWNDKANRMKELKTKIIEEQERINNFISMISKNEQTGEIKRKKKYNDMDVLVELFKNSTTIEEKIKYYQYICNLVECIEREIFPSE